MRLCFRLLAASVLVGSAHGQAVPASVAGSWRIAKILPTKNTACWGESKAKEWVGTTLRFGPHTLGGRAGEFEIPETLTRTLSRRKFQEEYKFDLAELGIRAPSVVELDLQHEDADVTGATTEVPGDTVLLAGAGRIVVSACGVYFVAVRAGR